LANIATDYGLSVDAIERHVARHLNKMAAPTRKAARMAALPKVEKPKPPPVVKPTPAPPPPPPVLEDLDDEPEPEPEPPKVEKPAKLNPQQQKAKFLEVLAEFGSITRACKAAGVGRAKVHRWLEEDELFGFAYHQSLTAATEGLEEVARERATRGAKIERQIWRQGRLIETVIEYRPSDAALITLLKAQKPDTYRERVDQSVSGEVSVRYTNDWRSTAAPAPAKVTT
jgi:hypothetical protein